ncbi:ATP-binding protein [Streptomyces sp. NPDC003036]|uniref:ATP-binding protein n=1 Tax=Streptomyces sp. NPDC003036 TaxID=3154442 RepID=UPI0033B8AE8D
MDAKTASPVILADPLAEKGRRAMTDTATKRFPHQDAAVPAVRAWVRETLASWQHFADRADDVLLCVSELATNAVRHVEDGEFLVELRATEGGLRVGVLDSSEQVPYVRHPTAEERSGRGLLLVQGLADDWGVDTRVTPGKYVWSEFKRTSLSRTETRACRADRT